MLHARMQRSQALDPWTKDPQLRLQMRVSATQCSNLKPQRPGSCIPQVGRPTPDLAPSPPMAVREKAASQLLVGVWVRPPPQPTRP
jgi:hypothetical protein